MKHRMCNSKFFVNVGIVFDDDVVVVVVVTVVFVVVFFRWCRRSVAEGRRDEILGVELFRRV
jgi:F0F1-type ATP synthase membrane subunit a